jgi:hypothetical protein
VERAKGGTGKGWNGQRVERAKGGTGLLARPTQFKVLQHVRCVSTAIAPAERLHIVLVKTEDLGTGREARPTLFHAAARRLPQPSLQEWVAYWAGEDGRLGDGPGGPSHPIPCGSSAIAPAKPAGMGCILCW